jgi:hypothetical protein
MRVDSSIFLVGLKHIPVCWELQSNRVFVDGDGLRLLSAQTVSAGLFCEAPSKVKEGYEDYSRCSLVVRPEY